MPLTIITAEITSTDCRPAGWWLAADGSRAVDLTGTPLHQAVADLLKGCDTPAQRAAILGGRLQVLPFM